MKMLQPSTTVPFAKRLSVALLGLLAAGSSTALGGDHTDFPDLSIVDPGKPRPPRGMPVVNSGPSVQPVIGHIIEWTVSGGEDGDPGANGSIAPPTFPKPPIGPVSNNRLFDSVVGNGSAIPGGTSGVPAPGFGGLLLIGAALTARRRR